MTVSTNVKVINDKFWDSRIAVTRTATLPAIFKQTKETGRWDSILLKWKHGDTNEPHIFWDSDIAKLIESVVFALNYTAHDDPQRELFLSWINEAIRRIGLAQHDDGYINIYYSVVKPGKQWTDLAHNHELYCAGHLLEAAVAHYQVTGSTVFLDIITHYVDHIARTFGPHDNQKKGYPGHQEIELALLKLYAVKPEKKYLDLAQFFIEQRGFNHGEYYDQEAIAQGIDPLKYVPGNGHPSWPEPPSYWYMQADDQIRNLEKIKGHSVRALYYLTAVQGLANITNDQTLHDAVHRLWTNMVDTKLYVHGGIGAIKDWEGFGDDYYLPLKCYSETCASIAILFLGKQILEHGLDGSVAAVMERALYNNVLGGISLDGTAFYYDQPLIGTGLKRSTWFECSCCPPNVTRLFNNLEEYVFTEAEDFLAVNLWIGASYVKKDFTVHVATEYPHEGQIKVDLSSETPVGFAIRAPDVEYEISIKSGSSIKNGYIYFEPRKWKDTLIISFDLKPKIIKPHKLVEATKGKLAIERGPFVYAVEQTSSAVPVGEVTITQETEFEQKQVEIEGVHVTALSTTVNGKPVEFLPYFVIGNRNPGEDFAVWIDEVNQ
ncbi:hypothetical protein V1514DRAFT_201709 [Lipomyces japonicus]|uniref:uncharacterized protein n=1 Tax=Lipomyces japonicus TaxID=56871 RepID=UPI0034CFB64A